MWWVGVIIVSPLWAMLSSQLFLQSWLAAIGVIFNLVGLVRGKVERSTTAVGVGMGVALVGLWGGLLAAGTWVLTRVLGFGYTTAENAVYWIFAVLSLLYFARQLPLRIKRTWRHANVAGALEEDMMDHALRGIRERLRSVR